MTHILKLLIADDEAPARSRLRELLSGIHNVEIVAEAKNGQEALNLINDNKPDIVLLDIRMPEMNGIETAQHLQKMTPSPAVIFTTAYDRYAIQAFDLNAVDYLLKPIRFERLQAAINKAHALLPKQLESIAALNPHRTNISIAERGRILLIPIADVIYFRADQKYTTLRTVEKEYLIEESLNHLEREFGAGFIRLHRNCLAAKAYILGYEKRLPETHDALLDESNIDHDDKNPDKHWVALLKNIPETIAVSRRQQRLIREN